jgi:hypothetical protein
VEKCDRPDETEIEVTEGMIDEGVKALYAMVDDIGRVDATALAEKIFTSTMAAAVRETHETPLRDPL